MVHRVPVHDACVQFTPAHSTQANRALHRTALHRHARQEARRHIGRARERRGNHDGHDEHQYGRVTAVEHGEECFTDDVAATSHVAHSLPSTLGPAPVRVPTMDDVSASAPEPGAHSLLTRCSLGAFPPRPRPVFALTP